MLIQVATLLTFLAVPGRAILPASIQVDVVFPQNDTYMLTQQLPIVFNIQNASQLWDRQLRFEWGVRDESTRYGSNTTRRAILRRWERGNGALNTTDFLILNNTFLRQPPGENVTRWELFWRMGMGELTEGIAVCPPFRSRTDNGEHYRAVWPVQGSLWFTTDTKGKPGNLSNLPECLPLAGQMTVQSSSRVEGPRYPANFSGDSWFTVEGNRSYIDCPIYGTPEQLPLPNSCGLAFRSTVRQRIEDYFRTEAACHPLLDTKGPYCPTSGAAGGLIPANKVLVALAVIVSALVGGLGYLVQ